MMFQSNSRHRGSLPILEIAGLLMILAAILIFMAQLSAYSQERQQLPEGLLLAGVPADGLKGEQALASIEQTYGAPVTVIYKDQEILLSPEQVGFRVNSEAMISSATELRMEGTFWSGFWDHLWQRPQQTYDINLNAEYSEEQLRAWVADLASRYESPPQPATIALETMSVSPGQPGETLDQEKAVADIAEALFQPIGRTVVLSINETDAPEPSMDTLETLLIEYLMSEKYEGVASIYIYDERNGDSLALDVDLRQGVPTPVNCDIAYAGLSTMKIPLMVGYFRYLGWFPYPYEYDVVESTMTLSSNLNANFMLRDIGGDNIELGPPVVTEMMHYLGMENSFIAAPYDDEDEPEYYSTPAREAARAGMCIDTNADYAMQTTAEDIALLLDSIYQCAEYDGGDLIAAYPDEINQTECQMMIDVMSKNDEGKLILAGVPEYVEVAHKHGYTYDTISDAGIVLSPGGNYVMVVFLWADVGWLANTAFPIMEGLSTATFNYFNPDLINEPRRGYGDVLLGGQ